MICDKGERAGFGEYEKELDLAQEIYADQEYVEIVENTDLHDKMKKIISKHGLVTGDEIDHFTQDINRPKLEEIFNDFKRDEGIRNVMKKYGAAGIMPHLITWSFSELMKTLVNKSNTKARMEQQWEAAEKILSWREMQPGVYRYHGIERRGTNDYGRPISVATLERNEAMNMYYAPSSLYWDLKNRSETNFIKYEGTQTSAKGYEYPVFKFAR